MLDTIRHHLPEISLAVIILVISVMIYLVVSLKRMETKVLRQLTKSTYVYTELEAFFPSPARLHLAIYNLEKTGLVFIADRPDKSLQVTITNAGHLRLRKSAKS